MLRWPSLSWRQRTSSFRPWGLPWTIRWVIALALLGFPVTLILAWVYEALLTESSGQSLWRGEFQGAVESGGGRPFISAVLLLASGALVAWGAFWAYQWSHGDPPTSSSPVLLDLADLNPQRIAVLPFDDLDNSESGEVFANAIHDDILHHLAKIDSLEVISRTTVEQYRDTEKRAPDMGEN